MAITYGPNLGLMVNGSQGEAHYSDLMKFFRGVDALIQSSVINSSTNTPPGSPSDGDRYIIGSSPTGAWSGKANQLARWSSVASAWEFYVPKDGWIVYDVAATTHKKYVSGGWSTFSGGGGGSSTLADVASNSTTTADQTFQINSATSFIISNSSASALLTIDEAAGTTSIGSNTFISNAVRSNSSAGLLLEAANGTDVVLLGVGNTANVDFYGTIKSDALTASRILASDASKNIVSLSTTTYPDLTELSYLKGATSSLQTQINGKEPTLTKGNLNGTLNQVIVNGGSNATNAIIGSTITLTLPQDIHSGASPTFAGMTLSGVTASRVLVTNGSSVVAASSVTSTELGYLSGVTSAIQTQIGGKVTHGGDTLTALMTIGTSDAYGVNIKTNNVTRIGIASGGAITFNGAYTFPTADGSSNYYLKTDGAGNLSWAAVAGGSSTLQNTYDNSTPSRITTDSTRAAVKIRRGSGADTDSVIDIENGAGTVVALIKGNGEIASNTLTASRILGSDSNKNIVSLSTSTYPDLTELAYVKGGLSNFQAQLNTKYLRPTTDISNSSNTNLTPTIGTPLYYRYPITSDCVISEYEFHINSYTSTGDFEIAIYTGTDTGNLTKVTNSSVTVSITSSGVKRAVLSTPITLTRSQYSYYFAWLAISGSYTLLQSSSFRNASVWSSTGATGASALPTTESTRNATNACIYTQPY